MLVYDQTVGEGRSPSPPPRDPLKVYLVGLSQAAGLFARNRALIISLAAICAFGGFALTKVMTPRYVATAQIYIDPHGLPGIDKDGTPQSEDSNGFINYVESQSVVITSRIVLERVVASEKLYQDEEFGAPAPSLLATLFRRAPEGATPQADEVNAAIVALASRVSVHRPERTFVIDVSVRSRDAEKAARLANAVAKTYIEVQALTQSDSARQASASLANKLETLRSRLTSAEKRVEDYKAENGIFAARDQTVLELQLKGTTEQLTAARARVDEVRAHYDQIQAARKRGGDIGSIAVALNLGGLGPLRTQQGLAQQKLADLSAELGPKHPQVRDAAARVADVARAIDAELARYAQSVHADYLRAQDTATALSRQLDNLKNQTLASDQTSIGLRDLQREADAARSVYDLFVTRSRQTGDIQQVEANAPTTRIITLASTPRDRNFPPRASLMAGAGLAIGFALGFALAALRERRNLAAQASSPRASGAARPTERRAPSPKLGEKSPPLGSPGKRGPPVRTPILAITQRTRLERRERRQSLARVDLRGLGFATVAAGADASELRAVFEALGLFERFKKSGAPRTGIVVAGSNETGRRTTLAINLALTAAGAGLRVALIDAASRNAKLTRAVRHTTNTPILPKKVLYETANGVLLALPKGAEELLNRTRPLEVLRYLLATPDEPVDLVICDGPDDNEANAIQLFDEADDIVVVGSVRRPTDRQAGTDPSVLPSAKVRAIVNFADDASALRKAS